MNSNLVKYVCLVLIIQMVSAQRLFISEMVIGSATDHVAIELFNPACSDVSLDDFSIELGQDGADWSATSIDFTGSVIPTEGTFVLCHTATDALLPSICDLTFNAFTLDGNDAIALLHNGVMIDHFGDAANWNETALSWDISYYDIAGVKDASSFHTLIRKATITQGIGNQLFAFPNGRNQNNTIYSEWIVNSADDISDLGIHTYNTSLCPSTILYASCGLTGSSSLLSDAGYYDIDIQTGSAKIQIDCPMDCLERAGSVIGGGTNDRLHTTSQVCLSAIHMGVFNLDISRLPNSVDNGGTYDAAITQSLCTSGLVPIITPFAQFPSQQGGIVSSRNRGRPRIQFHNDGIQSGVTGFDSTCVSSSTNVAVQDTFKVSYLNVTRCLDACYSYGNGECNQRTGQCDCYPLYYSNTSSSTENMNFCPFKECDPPCSVRNADLSVTLYSKGGPCSANTGTCSKCESASQEGQSGNLCLEFSCHTQGSCGNLAYGTSVTSSSNIGGTYDISSITDGNPYDGYGSTSSELGAFVDIDLGTLYDVGTIKLYLKSPANVSTTKVSNSGNYLMVSSNAFDALEYDVTVAVSTASSSLVLTDSDIDFANINENDVIIWRQVNKNIRYIRYQNDNVNQAITLRQIEVFPRISRGTCGTDGVCHCYEPFYGANCEYQACPGNCNENGSCNKLTGVCTCYSGYLGNLCDMMECSHDCSGFGTCDFSTGECSCIAGTDSHGNCRTGICPNSCSGHGYCNKLTRSCTCHDGYVGVDCSRAV